MDDHEDEPFKLEALVAEFASELQCILAQLLKQRIGIPEPEPIANRQLQVQTGATSYYYTVQTVSDASEHFFVVCAHDPACP